MRRKLAIITGLIIAAVLSQFPEYVQQYIQRVGGAHAELRQIAEDFRTDASKFGLSEDQALHRFKASDDTFLAERGESLEQTLQRYAFLTKHYAALKTKRPFGSLLAFVKRRDPTIAREAISDFQPGLPLTRDGATHAITGFLIGSFLFEGFAALVAHVRLFGGTEVDRNNWL